MANAKAPFRPLVRTPLFRNPENEAAAERYALDAVRRMAEVLASPGLDLGDERAAIERLRAVGFNDTAIDVYLADALERARGRRALNEKLGTVAEALATVVLFAGMGCLIVLGSALEAGAAEVGEKLVATKKGVAAAAGVGATVGFVIGIVAGLLMAKDTSAAASAAEPFEDSDHWGRH